MTVAAKTSLVSILLACLLWSTPATSQDATKCAGPPWNALEDLNGEFTVESSGQPVGQAHFTSVANSCGLTADIQLLGHALFYTITIDPANGDWQERIVISDNSVAQGQGSAQVANGSLQSLTTNGQVKSPDGSSNAYRTHYQRTAAGDLQQTGEVQQNGVWSEVFNIVLVNATRATSSNDHRRKEEERTRTEVASGASKSDPEPTKRTARKTSASASPSGQAPHPVVTTQPDLSSQVPGQQAIVTAKEGTTSRVTKIIVESPMLVELPLGPIDKLPKGYAWRSKDLAKYELERGTIKLVEVEKKTKRGKTSMLVTFHGHSEAFTSEYLITIQLKSAAGDVLSESVVQKLFTGRAVTAQVNEGVSTSTMEIKLDGETFEKAFSQEERPVLFIRIEALG